MALVRQSADRSIEINSYQKHVMVSMRQEKWITRFLLLLPFRTECTVLAAIPPHLILLHHLAIT